MKPRIAPSILAADFANLERDITLVERAGAQLLHVDVMDGHFVPNLTIGPPVVRAVRRVTALPLDVHLMVSDPEAMIDDFLDAGADYLSVHYEASRHLDLMLTKIRSRGVRAGVVLNPHTPVGVLDEILRKSDFVLLMSVNPGFGGQEFISTSFEKVRKLRDLIRSQDIQVEIEIDGGIDLSNVADAVQAGVDIVVAGTAVFGTKDPAVSFRQMQDTASRAAI